MIIQRMSELNIEQKKQVSSIFINAFAHMFEDLKIDNISLEKIFFNAFLEEHFHIAVENGKSVGLIGISDNKTRALKFDKSFIKKEVGFIKSLSTSFVLPMFEKPEVKNDTDCYIDFVAVDENYRSKGVGAKLFAHIYKKTNYNDYYLDVVATNTKAIKFYQRLSYIDTGAKTSKMLKLLGVPDLYRMKYSKV